MQKPRRARGRYGRMAESSTKMSSLFMKEIVEEIVEEIIEVVLEVWLEM